MPFRVAQAGGGVGSVFYEIASLRSQGQAGVMTDHRYWVYILTNRRNRVLYIGVTSDLERRIWQHKNKQIPGFTARYNCDKLVWFEETVDVDSAITAEKQIKAGSRAKKIARIEAMNPDWRDLAEDF